MPEQPNAESECRSAGAWLFKVARFFEMDAGNLRIWTTLRVLRMVRLVRLVPRQILPEFEARRLGANIQIIFSRE